MRLHLTENYIGPDYPRTFYRVEDWMRGTRIADFTSRAEAASFAIRDALARGFRFDHKVVELHLTRA